MFQGVGLVSWQLVYTKQAQKDAKKLAAAGLKEKGINVTESARKQSLLRIRLPMKTGRRPAWCMFKTYQYSASAGLSGSRI